MRPMTIRRAAVAGLLFAVFMCLWVWFDRSPGFDDLAIRFAIYFTVFTSGYYILTNFLGARRQRRD